MRFRHFGGSKVPRRRTKKKKGILLYCFYLCFSLNLHTLGESRAFVEVTQDLLIVFYILFGPLWRACPKVIPFPTPSIFLFLTHYQTLSTLVGVPPFPPLAAGYSDLWVTTASPPTTSHPPHTPPYFSMPDRKLYCCWRRDQSKAIYNINFSFPMSRFIGAFSAAQS